MKTTLKTAKFTFKTAFARCIAAKILCENGKMYAVFGGFMIDCGMFCRGSAVSMCYSDDCKVSLRWKFGAETVKLWCGDGKMVVYLRRVHTWFPAFLLPRWRNGGAMAAVAWCVSGVSNPDFPNFTKHSTVLTSILQQISILYQHFQSAKTAIPALEQAKTMLKIALPTFKNDENHTQNSKIHIQNSGCKVYLRWKCGAKTAKCMRC